MCIRDRLCDDQAAAQHTITTGTRRRDYHHRLVYLGAESNSHPQAHVKEELDMQPAPERHSGTPFNEIKVDLHQQSTYSLQYIQYMQCIQYKRYR